MITFVKTHNMKYILTLLLVFVSLVTYSQNKGYVYYLNEVKASEDIEQMKKYGLNVEFEYKLIDLEKFTPINKLLEDYKNYILTYYRQINSLKFLDTYQFNKLDKTKMKVQSVCYVQYKNSDVKWGGCKYFEIFHVNSDLYFTPYVKEYSDRYEMEVLIAEKIKGQLP
jgi:hypothetical protein